MAAAWKTLRLRSSPKNERWPGLQTDAEFRQGQGQPFPQRCSPRVELLDGCPVHRLVRVTFEARRILEPG